MWHGFVPRFLGPQWLYTGMLCYMCDCNALEQKACCTTLAPQKRPRPQHMHLQLLCQDRPTFADGQRACSRLTCVLPIRRTLRGRKLD